jgi:hypothetical protein
MEWRSPGVQYTGVLKVGVQSCALTGSFPLYQGCLFLFQFPFALGEKWEGEGCYALTSLKNKSRLPAMGDLGGYDIPTSKGHQHPVCDMYVANPTIIHHYFLFEGLFICVLAL